MARETISKQLQLIFVEHFNIPLEQFDWELPLEALNHDFKMLSYLMFLEQLLEQHFAKKIPLMENISTAFHTPKDVLLLINNEL